MSLCKENIEKISAYVDNELERSECDTLEKHLGSCEMCQEVLRATRRGKELMHESYSAMKAPAHLLKQIKADIKEEVRQETARFQVPFFKRFFTPGPAWAALSLVLVLVAGTMYLRTEGIIAPGGEKPTTVGLYLYDIAHDAYLVKALPERPLEIASASCKETEAYLSKHVGFPVRAPEMAEAGLTMQGGRLWHTIARISSLIEYVDDNGNKISLFEVSRERIGLSGGTKVEADGFEFYLGDAFGFNGVVWLQHEVALGFVADLPHDRLLEIAAVAAADLAR